MNKKLIVATCSAFMLISAVCHGEINIETYKNSITIKTKTEPGTVSTFVLVRDGGSLENDSDIYAMKRGTADKAGNVVFSFSMPDDMGYEYVENVYDVYIKHENNDINVYDDGITYVTAEHRNQISLALENASSADSLAEIFDNPGNAMALKSMGVDYSGYNSLKDKNSACILCSGYDTEIDKIRKFNIAVSVALINEEFKDEYMEIPEFEFEDVKYTGISDSKLKSFIDEYIESNRNYEKIDDIYTAYSRANALYIINNSRFDKIEENLEKYAKILGIENENAYEDYGKCNYKTKVNEILAKAEDFKSISQLLDGIDDAMIEAKPRENFNGGSGGGNGGSRRTPEMNSAVSIVTIPSVEKKEFFSDISGVEWAKEAIDKMAEKGYISGDGSGKFNPDKYVTREEFVKMLVMVADMYNENAKSNFSDVKSGAWYESYIASAYKNGLVSGVTENTFGVGKFITRQDMAVICYRVLEKKGIPSNERDFNGFQDEDTISDYAKEAVKELYILGMINGTGDGCFSPLLLATRAQSAVMIYNLLIK